jgi:hypothetical protein
MTRINYNIILIMMEFGRNIDVRATRSLIYYSVSNFFFFNSGSCYLLILGMPESLKKSENIEKRRLQNKSGCYS